MGRGRLLFHETQSFSQRRAAVALAIPPCGMLCLLIWQVILGHPWGKQPTSNVSVVFWTAFLWLLYVRLITVRLVTDVRTDELVVAMRGLWPARRIPLAGIQSAETVTFDAERDYGGYGIRSSRQGKAYIASGNRGVRLKLADGSTFLVGSQKPGELASLIKHSATRA
jgi:hypothetical protein